jgi:hypothetical protein
MILPSKVKFLVVSQGGLMIGTAEYWFRNGIWECVAVGKKVRWIEGLRFQQAEQACRDRNMAFKWKPSNVKFVRELKYPALPKYDHIFST